MIPTTNLMPCCIKKCDEIGRWEIAGNGVVFYFCTKHAEEFAKAHTARGGTINSEEDDEG